MKRRSKKNIQINPNVQRKGRRYIRVYYRPSRRTSYYVWKRGKLGKVKQRWSLYTGTPTEKEIRIKEEKPTITEEFKEIQPIEKPKETITQMARRFPERKHIYDYFKKDMTTEHRAFLREIKGRETEAYKVLLLNALEKEEEFEEVTNQIEKIKHNLEYVIDISGTMLDEEAEGHMANITVRGKTINEVVNDLIDGGLEEEKEIDSLKLETFRENHQGYSIKHQMFERKGIAREISILIRFVKGSA